jgi:hypothetical protein
MILYTIQSQSWYDSLKDKKVIISYREENLSEYDENDKKLRDFFKLSYDWMSEQMRLRLPEYPSSHLLWPLWAWYQWDSVTKKVPDLRCYRHLKNYVRIEFEIDDSLVLLSEFEAWHYVLNDWMLKNDEHDGDENPDEEDKRKSWNNIFDLSFLGPKDCNAIQATFWELNINQVKKVKEFGKSK